LFELALLGWSYENYSSLSERDQLESLKKSNDKMKYLFGNSSNIFSAPYDEFNDDTLKAMDRLNRNIKIDAL
jgi:peptidoglycan/xylan/chitin deacetylase (PgdA/CDA1 family)